MFAIVYTLSFPDSDEAHTPQSVAEWIIPYQYITNKPLHAQRVAEFLSAFCAPKPLHSRTTNAILEKGKAPLVLQHEILRYLLTTLTGRSYRSTIRVRKGTRPTRVVCLFYVRTPTGSLSHHNKNTPTSSGCFRVTVRCRRPPPRRRFLPPRLWLFASRARLRLAPSPDAAYRASQSSSPRLRCASRTVRTTCSARP